MLELTPFPWTSLFRIVCKQAKFCSYITFSFYCHDLHIMCRQTLLFGREQAELPQLNFRYSLMQECWAHSPDLRPTFSALVNKSVFIIIFIVVAVDFMITFIGHSVQPRFSSFSYYLVLLAPFGTFRLASSLGEGEYLSVESEQEEDYLIPLQVQH